MRCSELSDELILESYAEGPRKTLRTYYYEPETIVIWRDQCAASLEETEAWAAATSELEESDVSTSTTDYFYEVAYCSAASPNRVRYRQLRCDYYDGEFFTGSTPSNGDAPGFLGSLLWFAENHDVTGNQFLSSARVPGNAKDTAEFCTIQTTFGDFGLCDEITLEAWRISIDDDGSVELSGPSEERTLRGTCH